jgi:foldase protein PrsA
VSKPITSLLALAAALALCAGLSACGGIPSGAVVQVDGTAISKDAFNHWMTVASNAGAGATATGAAAAKPVAPVPPAYTACIAHFKAIEPKPAKGAKPKTEAQLKTQCEQQYTAFKQQVLGYLITSQWVLAEAQSLGVSLSDKEVKKEFAKVKSQQFPTEEAFKKFLATRGESISDLLLGLKVQTLSSKIEKKVTEKAKATAAQAHAYYNAHQSTYGTPEKRNLLIVLTKTEAQATSAKQEISSGKSFASVAKKVSIDPTTKNSGGQLNEVVKGQEEQALDTAVFAAKKDVLGGPVKTPFGYYVFEVKKIMPGNATGFTQVRAQVEQQLTAEQQQKALGEFVKNFRKKWEAKTECRSEYSVTDCKGYKAPSTPVAPPATSTAPTTTTTPARTPKPSTGATKK